MGIIQEGSEAVLNYFNRFQTERTEKLYEAKLLILGEPGSGKSTLVNKLVDGINAAMPEPDDSTKGIAVKSKNFKTPFCNWFIFTLHYFISSCFQF